MALKYSEDCVIEPPVVIETSRVLDWIFVSVDIDSIRVVIAGRCKGNLCAESQQVIISIGAALHLTDGSLIGVHISGKGARGVRVQPKVETSSALPLVDE